MIELLILYILEKREKTVYGIRQEILDKFGTFTKPSLGTIHPALKRLLNNNTVKVRSSYSDGGKKKTVYEITNEGKKYFNELFLKDFKQNPSTFYNEFQTRLSTISMLNRENREIFFEQTKNKLELQDYEIKNTLNNTYIKLDFAQVELLKTMQKELKSINELLENIKNHEH